MVLMRLLIWPVLVIGITVFIVQNKIETKNKFNDIRANYPILATLESVFTSHAFELIEDHEIGDVNTNYAVFSHPACENSILVLEFKILHTIRKFINQINRSNQELVYYYLGKTYDRQNRPLLYSHFLLESVKYSLGMTEMLPLRSAFALFSEGDCAPLEQLPWNSIWGQTYYQKWLQINGQTG